MWHNANGNRITTGMLLQAYNILNGQNASDCDAFFSHHGPGNIYSINNRATQIILSEPFERLSRYELILIELERADTTKYHAMHKGTPFYFMSWLAFTIQDYEKAVYYMDAAISEDIRLVAGTANPNSWQTTPAATFLLLDPSNPGPPGQAITVQLADSITANLVRLNNNTSSTFTLTQFRDDFLIPNIGNAGFRSIISGLYVFMLEFDKRMNDLKLGSTNGGSIKPFLLHLFSGGVVFESLLKTTYAGSTLGQYLRHATARADLEIDTRNPVYYRDQPRPAGYDLPGVIGNLSQWNTETYQEKIVAIAFALRNTAGHDLSWVATFNEVVYRELYESICDAILWFIWKVKV